MEFEINGVTFMPSETKHSYVIINVIIIIIQLVIKTDQAPHRHLEIHVESLKQLRLKSVSDKTMANRREVGLSGVQLYLHV